VCGEHGVGTGKLVVRSENGVPLQGRKQLAGFKEVFDDSGTFPVGDWLEDFLSRRNPGITFGCNMRMVDAPWKRMKDWGFRMILFGVESANQKTLDRIQKGVKVEDIEQVKKAAEAGLEPHIAVMFGYPWETSDDAERTLSHVQYLLKNGFAKTCQASFYTPDEKSGNAGHKRYVDKIFDVAFSPSFWINKIKSIKSKEDDR
jgi:hypothetical protein